jgi:hypothetical protein
VNVKDMLMVTVSVLVAALLAVVALVLLGSTAALAEPAQQFGLQLSAKPDGQVAFGLRLRTYDTTGAVPPAPTSYFIRFPRGAGLRREFLNAHYQCDGPALRRALDLRPSSTPFPDRIANLKPFIRSLARSSSTADRVALANARVCERARLGSGTGLIDARDAVRVIHDPIPVRFSEFLSRGTAPGAIAGVIVLGAADERSAVVKRFPVVAGVHAAIPMDIVDDPTPDGLYGLKLMLPTGPISGFDVRIAEAETTVRSLELRKGTCLRQGRNGRCVRRQSSDVHSFVLPACPSDGELSAQMFTGYAPPTPSITTTIPVPCPVYSRALMSASLASAAAAPAPEPVVRLAADVTPGRLPIANGTPLTLTLDTRFASVPTGGNFVLQSATFLFGSGSRFNAKLFPSCSAAMLRAARGRLSVCPKGSKIGGGFATGNAVALGVSSRAKVTVFNGPGGRSVTMNVSVVNPALINETLALPVTRLRDRYEFKLAATVPEELKTVLGGDVVVSRILVRAGATRIVDGVRRGYFEALNCPRGGSPIHGDFVFNQGRRASADLTVVC